MPNAPRTNASACRRAAELLYLEARKHQGRVRTDYEALAAQLEAAARDCEALRLERRRNVAATRAIMREFCDEHGNLHTEMPPLLDAVTDILVGLNDDEINAALAAARSTEVVR
jgi:hypothetical protein